MDIQQIVTSSKNVSYALKHMSVLEKLYTCRMATVKDLYEFVQYKGSYEAFRRLVLRLEDTGTVDSLKFNSAKGKFLTLNEKFKDTFWQGNNYSICEEMFVHDSLVSKLLIQMVKAGLIESFCLPHEFHEFFYNKDLKFTPDAIAQTKKGNIAIEVELHQKNRERLFRKFNNIIDSGFIKSVLYICLHQGVFESYVLRAREFEHVNIDDEHLINSFKSKFFVSHLPSLGQTNVDFKELNIYNPEDRKIFN